MSIKVNHARAGHSLPRLADVREARLREIRKRVANYAREWQLGAVPVEISKDPILLSNRAIFYACAHKLNSIRLQDHWLLRREDIPNTKDPEKLKRWFAYFMGIPLKTIDNSFYKEVIDPVIKMVCSREFDQILDFALLHELGHIYGPLHVKHMTTQRKVIRVAALFLACIAIGLAITAIAHANFLLFAVFLVAFIGCLLTYKWIPQVPTIDDSKSCERKADFFAGRANPQNVPAFMRYMEWVKHRNRVLRNDPIVPRNVRDCFTRDGEFANNTTHPTCAERIAYLQPFLHKC